LTLSLKTRRVTGILPERINTGIRWCTDEHTRDTGAEDVFTGAE
jgi:hypothetical protein